MKNYPLSCKRMVGLLVVIGLAGCSVFRPIGQENFDCSGKNSTDPYCRSMRGIDRSTVGNIPDTRFDKPFDYLSYSQYHGDLDEEDAGGGEGKAATAAKPPGTTTLLPHEIGRPGPVIAGAPVRAAPVLQKIWFNRYVDRDDKLHQPNEIYQEVIASRWVGAAAPSKRNASTNGSASPYPFKPAKEGGGADKKAAPADSEDELPIAPMPDATMEQSTTQSLTNPQ